MLIPVVGPGLISPMFFKGGHECEMDAHILMFVERWRYVGGVSGVLRISQAQAEIQAKSSIEKVRGSQASDDQYSVGHSASCLIS